MSNRRGFSLMEVTIVSGLMAGLAVMLSNAWIGMGRPTADVSASIRLLQELDISVLAISRDFGGNLPGNSTQTPSYGALVDVKRDVSTAKLMLCYDTDGDGIADWSNNEDTIVTYYVDDSKTDSDGASYKILVRSSTHAGTTTTFTVARDVDSLAVDLAGGEYRTVTLKFKYPDLHGVGRFDPWNYYDNNQSADRPHSTWVRDLVVYDPDTST